MKIITIKLVAQIEVDDMFNDEARKLVADFKSDDRLIMNIINYRVNEGRFHFEIIDKKINHINSNTGKLI